MTDTFKCILLFTFLLHNSKCARKSMEGFIIGGKYATIQDFPHSVYLAAHCGEFWACGGSILNQRIVLTAAHCIFGCDVEDNYEHSIAVNAGSENLDEITIKRMVTGTAVHEKYHEVDLTNDIALAIVGQSIPLRWNTKRVIIQSEFPPDAHYAKVAGWGIVDDQTGVSTTILKYMPQKLRSKATCSKISGIAPGMFCAGSLNYYDDHPAEGDSGGALITSRFIAIGIVSFNIGTYPALLVYTNISYYYPWVAQNAKKLYCNE